MSETERRVAKTWQRVTVKWKTAPIRGMKKKAKQVKKGLLW